MRTLSLLLVTLAFGCGDSDPGTDAGRDAGADGATDGGSDSGSDGGSDGAVDSGVDAAFDGAVDTGIVDGSVADTGPTPGCDPGVGLASPIPACSAADPCTNLLPTYALFTPPVERIEAESEAPTCATGSFGTGSGHAVFDDGPPRSHIDAAGTTRYWCEARPSLAGGPRPLVLYVTGSGGSATGVYDSSRLREKQPTFDLAGDPARQGYVLVSIQPRNLHWPTTDPQEGTKSDSQYRDLASPSSNRDVAFVDHVIDTLVAEGVVDPRRIYLMGWSNGARFTIFYGIARHETATPGGNRVAAVANYSGGDPFAPPTFDDPTCQASPYPTSEIPYYLVSRACDAIACNAAHDLGTVPGNVVEPWVDTLRDVIGADVTWQILHDDGSPRATCALASACGPWRRLDNHVHWPDGLADGGGQDHEPVMLGFLRDHPLPL